MWSFWIIVFILMGLSNGQILEGDALLHSVNELEGPISPKRICQEEKDYVDSSVMFRDRFIVTIDKMYFEFWWISYPFNYAAEGPQHIPLIEYDQSWHTHTEIVPIGRFLGGFYFNLFDAGYWDDEGKPYEFYHLDIDMHPYWRPDFKIYESFEESMSQTVNEIKENKSRPHVEGIQTVNEIRNLAMMKQVIFFKDDHNIKDIYHIKGQTEWGHYYELNSSHKWFHGVPPRGSLRSFLNIEFPKNLDSLPIIHDYERLQLLVIKNQKDFKDVPRLYYNSFKFINFTNNWKNVKIDPGFRYNAFIPLCSESFVGFVEELTKEESYRYSYYVIAEPFRDTTKDKTRGPSFLFRLKWDEKTGIPSLKKTNMTGMSVFGCKFIPPSSKLLYWVFGVIIAILVIILVSMCCFVTTNYFMAKDRIVILKKTDKDMTFGTSSSSGQRTQSLDRSRLRHTSNRDVVSVDDKRSASLSIGDHSDNKPTKKGIKI